MTEKTTNMHARMTSSEIRDMVQEKMHSLLSQVEKKDHYETPEVLDEEDIPLYLPTLLARQFYDFLKQLFIELKGPNAPLEKLNDSLLKHVSWAIRYEDDAKFAYEDAERRTLWERLTRTNHEDIETYTYAQYRYTEYVLKAMAIDFLEDVTGNDRL